MLARFQNSSTVEKLKNSLHDKSILEVLGVGRRELSHSNFLAWLLNPNESHGLGYYSVKKLLLILAGKGPDSDAEKESIPEELLQRMLLGTFIFKGVKVQTEVLTKFIKTENWVNDDGRVDIVIDIEFDGVNVKGKTVDNLMIVLENKVFSSENGKYRTQTKVYHDYFERKKADNQHCVYVYLTPIGKPRCSDPHFIHITYQDILDKILIPATERPELAQRTLFILKEYIKNLSITIDNKNNNVPMAMTKEQVLLLKNFWDENSDLIMTCMEALSEDPECGMQDDIKKVKETLDTMNNSRHFFKMKFDYDGTHYPGPYGQGRLVQAIIKAYVDKHKNCTYADLLSVFPDNLQNPKAKNPYGCLRLYDDPKVIADKKRYFCETKDIIRISNSESVVVCSQWGTLKAGKYGEKKGNFPLFRKHAEDLGVKIMDA